MAPRLHVATRKGWFLYEKRNGRYAVARTAFLGDPVSIVLPDARTGSLYAALNLGHFGVKLRRSTDDGGSWEEIASPEYPPRPEDDVPGPEEKPGSWSLQQIWALEPGGPEEKGRLWCGTIPGGLFRSDDGGASWSLVRSLWDRPERKQWFGGGYDWPGIHSIHVDPRDPKHVTVAVSCGGVWTSFDGGIAWQVRTQGMFADYMPPERREDPTIQDPHLLSACAAVPDVWWVQHHNGVFRTEDGGIRWSHLDAAAPSGFGFAVAAHPKDPKTAWFVPAVKDECRIPKEGRVVVSRTRDGGKSFEVVTRGLPQEHAYDLVYRHALDVDGTGEVLAMGSTTGSLWVSEDGGDSWSAVTHHLPPVYAVRWGE